MAYICIQCGLQGANSNFWCQRSECVANALTDVFDYGEQVGEFVVQRLIHVTRTASYYEAKRGKQRVILKVAHQDTPQDTRAKVGYADLLKIEAERLELFQSEGKTSAWLPRLINPYMDTELSKYVYGKVDYRGAMHYYTVYEYIPGEFLRDMLNANPQPPIKHSGYITIQVIKALLLLAKDNAFIVSHLAISPDVIFIRRDADNIPIPMLFELGLGVRAGTSRQPERLSSEITQQLERWIDPTYIAPELLSNNPLERPGEYLEATDVYGVALLLYEMLAGHPPYPRAVSTDRAVRQAVVDRRIEPLRRTDLPNGLSDLLIAVLKRNLSDKYQRTASLTAFGGALQDWFGRVPPERKPRVHISLERQLLLLGIGIFVVMTLIAIGLAGAT